MPLNIKKYNVGLLGLGKVLRTLIKHYLEQKEKIVQKYGFELNFSAIADSRSFIKGKDLDLKSLIATKPEGKPLGRVVINPLKNFYHLLESRKIDILVDGLPGSRVDAGISYLFLVEALKNGINIICVNKSPLVFKGNELFNLANKKGLFIGISATAAGALPASGIINNELINAGIYNVRGVLNGTSNYVLDKIMFESKTKLQAVQDAIRLGIAEPDYRFDLEGIDTCYKMIIIGLIITGKCGNLKSISCKGIMDIDEQEIMQKVQVGKVVRLIGNLSINNGVPIISVSPEVLDKIDPLYAIFGANKGITFNTKFMGTLTVIGGASGLVAIAATIMKDIIHLHRQHGKKI